MKKESRRLTRAIGMAVTSSLAINAAQIDKKHEIDHQLPMEKFILPPKASVSEFNSFTSFMKAVGDPHVRQALLKDNAGLTSEMREILFMLEDAVYQKQVKKVNAAILGYRAGTFSREEVLEKTKGLSEVVTRMYPKAYEALQRSYLEYAKNNGFETNPNGGLMLVGEIQQPSDIIGANTIAIANIFAVVNVSIWSNALAVVLLVAI